MKSIIFITLLVLLAAVFASTEVEKGLSAIEQSLADKAAQDFLKLLKDFKEPTCAEQVETFRKYWRFVPGEIQEKIIVEIVRQLHAQLPGIPYEVIDKLVRDFGNREVPAQDACENARKIIEEYMRKRQACIEKCMEAIDLSPERLIKLIAKCKTNFRCYLDEIQQELQQLAGCIQKCIFDPKNPTPTLQQMVNMLVEAAKEK